MCNKIKVLLIKGNLSLYQWNGFIFRHFTENYHFRGCSSWHTALLVKYSYFLQNSQPDAKDYEIAKQIAKDFIEIWKAVIPTLAFP